jgi:hypothetical protein
MRELQDKASKLRQKYIEVTTNLIKDSLKEFFRINCDVSSLEFVIYLPNWNTYRDNPLVSNWRIEMEDGSIHPLNQQLDIHIRESIGNLNIIFRDIGIGLISLFGSGNIRVCKGDF